MTLEQFAQSWLSGGTLRPPVAAYERAGENVGITLYRDDRFQVQIWTLPPNSVVTAHRHPETDSILVRIAGKFQLWRNERHIPLSEMDRTSWLGMRTWSVRIRPNDLHEVLVGEPGGSFLTISERTDGKQPVSVQMDWTGAALDERHAAALEA